MDNDEVLRRQMEGLQNMYQGTHPGKIIPVDLPPPYIIPLRCRLGFHPWDRWGSTEIKQIFKAGRSIEAAVQSRICPGCGLRESHLFRL